jgi:hypothetical protein
MLLARAPIAFNFQVHFFVDEASASIEDPSVEWGEAIAPYVTVARRIIRRREFADAAARQFDAQVEAGGFDSQTALMAHRPLGNVMRARKVVYLAGRKA